MIESLLIIQTGFLGDAVLGTGMLRAVRAVAPSVRVGYLVRVEFADLMTGHPGIASLHTHDKRAKGGTAAIIDEIKRAGYSTAIVPHRSARSTMIPFRAGIGTRVGFRQSDLSFLFTRRIEYDISLPEIDRNASLLQGVGIDAPSAERYGWLVPSSNAVEAMRKFSPAGDSLVLIAPGSVWETKRWTADGFSTLGRELSDRGYQVRFIGSREEEELCDAIAGRAGLPKDYVLAGKLSLSELVALCSIADRVVTNDSAPLHIAESVGTPVTALFGPTVPEFGFAPYLPGSTVIERRNMPCRPCGIHGHRSCPIGTHECMTSLSVDDVLASMEPVVLS